MPAKGWSRRGTAAGAVLALALATAAIAQQAATPEVPPAPADAVPATGAAPPATDLNLRPSVDSTVPPGPAVDPAMAEQLQALDSIEASISVSRERADALKKEIADMQGDRTKQNAALIAAAERVKLAETDIVALEDKLGDLIVQELEVRGRLDGADNNISNVLAALERISQNPPPALIVNPSDALGSARSAILIAAILPELRKKADAVMADLTKLGQIKADALEQQGKLEANLEILEEEQLRIGTLIAARKENENRASTALAEEEAEAQALASKATSLKQLIDDLQKRAAAVATAAQATATANAGGPAPTLDKDTVRLALANTNRSEPAVPFAQAKGFLAMPSSGVTVIDYGAGDGFGGISRGLSVVTRADAQVVSPADGWVMFQGDYLNYGQIVILNAGQDYTILLAGLAKVDVQIGQFVMMGEPVGSMGSQTIGRTVATSAGVSRPTLYIEMRKNNEPVDPTGWWSPASVPTQSG
ncbi:MAG: peptidoglycan DD-metalloendopeptidase family protein [Devosia sp.]|uniref:murein hydrolase activator EnvC family protein n=1 Tax=Devosia sp. TaxID=1871048 RepID=UPI00261728CD|nr:peptidoglycan DD-metalloendopeptidase family protein [Devosia sp.]MDB5539049.1 peptidoglycan DD-metalloendopeptidase family protein [Devosia sp.]